MQTVLRQRRSVLIQLCVGYAYAHNNPATFYDTSGLKDEEETGSYKWVHPEKHFDLPDNIWSESVFRKWYGPDDIQGWPSRN